MAIYYDTSALLAIEQYAEEVPQYVVPQVVYELQKLKYEQMDSARAYGVRRAIRAIEEEKIFIKFPNQRKVQKFIKKHNMPDNPDSRIIVGSLMDDIVGTLLTQDKAQALIAGTVFPYANIRMIQCDQNSIDSHNYTKWQYNGWTSLNVTDDQIAGLYSDSSINRFGLTVNQYAKLYQENKLIDIIRWDGEQYQNLKYKDIKSRFLGDISPLDPQQKMLFDMLQNKDIKVQLITGTFGTGKSFIALAHAIDFVQRGYYDGIVFVRNNYTLKDTRDIGALPGTQLDKIFPYLMPVADHVGGTQMLNEMIEQRIIQPVHLGFLRGRDIKNKIILCDQCQNMTKQQMQLLIGRISKGSQLWLVGDRKQTDHITFEKNSGIAAITERLAGDPLFATVKLVESHRSEAAKLADKMD